MNDLSRWLQAGKQTKITDAIQKLSQSIKGEDFRLVINILAWMRKNIREKPEEIDKYDVFRKRTAEKIIKDGFSVGCSDHGIVFIAIARAKGLPAKYLETISTDWLEKGGNKFTGHIFSTIYIDDKWYLVDPTDGYISVRHRPNPKRYVVSAEGLDSWDLGIRNFDDLEKFFNDFRYEKRGTKGL